MYVVENILKMPQEYFRKWKLSEIKIIRRLLPLMKRYPFAISASIVMGCLATLLEGIGIGLFIPILYSLNVDKFKPESDDWLSHLLSKFFEIMPANNRLIYISLLIFGMVFLRGILFYVGRILTAWLNARLSHHLCRRIFDQLLSVSVRFVERNPSGKLMNTLEWQTYTTSNAVSRVIDLIVKLFAVITFTSFLLLISWKFTGLVIVVLGVISLFTNALTHRVELLSQEGLKADESFYQNVSEFFRGMHTIRAYAREQYEQEQFNKITSLVSKIKLRFEIFLGFIDPLSEILATALIVFILIFAYKYSYSMPAVLVFIFILYRLRPHLSELDEIRTTLIGASSSVKAVTDLIDRKDKPYIQSGSVHFTGLREAIKFESVYYQYEPFESAVLQDFSVRIPKGKTTAIVGLSGSGKSTLINLLLRFYDPDDGAIYVDNLPLKDLKIDSWRNRLAIVRQDEYIFNKTVRENITYGSMDATEDEIIFAAKVAMAHEFIQDLPEGYDTILGDHGTRLSAGQKQRLAIARAIVRRPDILLLDEATNAIDSISESQIQKNLNKIEYKYTVIIVAHRLFTIEHADHIIVLDAGRVVEQGSGKQLLKNKALFAKLYDLQKNNAH